MSPFYRAEDVARLHWRSWDTEHVVYDDASGDTHLLSDFARALLEQVAGPGADLDTLANRVAAERHCALDGALAYEVKRTMDVLVTAGLVRRDNP